MLRHDRIWLGAGLLALPLLLPTAHADEGGIGFWVPGLQGSLAALPGTPGRSYAGAYYGLNADAGSDKQFPRGGRLDAGVDATGNLFFATGMYTFKQPVLGGQAAVSHSATGGQSKGSVTATIVGPRGGSFTGSLEDERTAFGDLFPMATIKWNNGVHSYMTYLTANIPVGAYDPDRLANLGLGHAAYDAGGAYTYFNPKTGWEFSASSGLTYNLFNNHTDYRNGTSLHLDLGASRFLSEHLHVGLVGYGYQQLTGDSGAGATLGDFKSRVFGIGPQIGYMFDAGRMDGYLNLKGYGEVGAENRAEGWNVWLTLAFSPKAWR